jgi:hypothetical protein
MQLPVSYVLFFSSDRNISGLIKHYSLSNTPLCDIVSHHNCKICRLTTTRKVSRRKNLIDLKVLSPSAALVGQVGHDLMLSL